MFGGNKKKQDPGNLSDSSDRHSSDDRTLTPSHDYAHAEPTKAQLKRATRTRLCWALLTSLLLLISVVFLILVEVGNTSVNKIRNRIYFLKLDLTNVIPLSVPNAVLINSVAQTLGLHDFYTVGLWGYCEGYNGQGVTACSDPKALYWFNPVAIIKNELLAGASIALPAEVNSILGLIRTVSHWMFGLFLTGACLNFVLIPLVILSIYTRWATFPLTILTFLGALFTTVATVVATVLFIIAQRVVTSQQSINIGASIGVEMFVFMWISAATSILAWLIMFGQCCCCASRRDVKKGKKRGSKKAWRDSEAPADALVHEKEAPKKKKGMFGRKKKEEV